MISFDDVPELRRALARAVLDDLEDRRCIGSPLLNAKYQDPEIYAEIEAAIGQKIVQVLEKEQSRRENEIAERRQREARMAAEGWVNTTPQPPEPPLGEGPDDNHED